VYPSELTLYAERLGLPLAAALKIITDNILFHGSDGELSEVQVEAVLDRTSSKIASIGQYSPTNDKLIACVSELEINAGYLELKEMFIPLGYTVKTNIDGEFSLIAVDH
jgi:hypothetical protein